MFINTYRNRKLVIFKKTDNSTHSLKCSLCFILLFLLFYASCSIPGGNQKTNRISFTVQNTLRIERKNVPIVLTLDQLQKVSADFSLNAYSVVTGQSTREVMIPAQADDLDYDGVRDQLAFLIDLESEETKEFSILYDPNVKATFYLEVNKLTRAGIFPELNVIAALESDLIAYLLKPNGAVISYGKKREELFSVDSMFQYELQNGQQLSPDFRLHFDRNGIALTQRPQALTIESLDIDSRWIINDLENQVNFYVRKDEEELNLYKSIGISLNDLLNAENTTMVRLTSNKGLIGCGGYALWNNRENELIPISNEGDYVRIIANGAIRSIVQRIIPEWNINGETLKLTSTTFIYGGNQWIEQHINLDKAIPQGYNIVVGIPKNGDAYDVDENQNLMWSWGTDSEGAYPLGIALTYPKTLSESQIDADPDMLSMILHPDEEGHIKYRTLAIWEGGIMGIETESKFIQHLAVMTSKIDIQPIIKFLPLDDKK